jgi:hypothetical protein
VGKVNFVEEKTMKVKPDRTKTLGVPEAGRIYFGLGKNASYEAAHRGDIPTIKIGRRYRAVVPAIERMLARAGEHEPDAA